MKHSTTPTKWLLCHANTNSDWQNADYAIVELQEDTAQNWVFDNGFIKIAKQYSRVDYISFTTSATVYFIYDSETEGLQLSDLMPEHETFSFVETTQEEIESFMNEYDPEFNCFRAEFSTYYPDTVTIQAIVGDTAFEWWVDIDLKELLKQIEYVQDSL